LIISSRKSHTDPTTAWPRDKSMLAAYHGMDSGGNTNATVSTLILDRWLGHKLPLGLGFLGQTNWAGLDTVANSIGGYVGIRDNVIISIPMSQTGTSLAEVAEGTYDSYFTTVATKIAALFPRAYIRIGWEFNGNWYAWAARDHEEDYIACFQRIVNLFRAIPGNKFTYVWNPDKRVARYAGSGYADPTDCYPGNDYVDYIAIDAYNGWVNGVNAPTANADGTGGQPAAGETPYPIPNQENRWNNEIVGVPYGNVAVGTAKPFCLAWLAAYGAEKGKPIMIPEWGTGFDSDSAGRNCGDDGYYVQKMAEWIVANDVVAHGYWNRITGGFNSRISYFSGMSDFTALDSKPNAQAAFLAAFGV